MFFEVNDREPIYLQIIRHIKQSLVIGNLKPGDHIPSRRELAEMLKVNPNTVQRAYKEMGDMNIINTFKNYQSSVTVDENILKNLKLELINESLSVFIEDMKAINVSKEEVLNILESLIRDIIVYKELQDKKMIMNIDKLEYIDRFSSNKSYKKLSAMLEKIREARINIRNNGNYSMVISVMLMGLSEG